MTREKQVTNENETGSKGQIAGLAQTEKPVEGATISPTGRRQALRGIGRELSEKDFASLGVQKLLLDELEKADTECEELKVYVEKFHDADKRAAVLEEHTKTVVSIEIAFGIGVGLGCAIIGLAPSFWKQQPQGLLCLFVGGLLVIGAFVVRIVKR